LDVALIIAADEPAIFFSSVEVAEQYIEPIDVRNGIYTAVYGPAGEPYGIEADHTGVRITRILDAPNQPDQLKALLLNYFDAVGEVVTDESLPALLARCRIRE
jgi:hypothetical protein